ncbi:EAL domain-containing protein [Rhodobacteraceae bacterium RKSG542]|uniref:GGDEF/EAL domain-containing response regulator n=1 Tax=Pseudovibrio flavus TaxID=2529854 RepID=UPI0012BCB8F0|nr:EAL domain-containing protein [Pseudovibrio flavus]MTI16480.1 EAL domain-containing protein [Pseudovibrio flavus]
MSVIVIVDDRAINRSILNRLALAVDDSVETKCFSKASEALAYMRQSPPDLVVTDYSMPEMDGAELTGQLRATPGCSDVPVIVITVFTERVFRIKALEAGATDFLQSPVDHNEFLSRARNLLALRKEQLAAKNRASDLENQLSSVEQRHLVALRDTKEQLGQVIDSVPALITAVDPSGVCSFANTSWASFVGTPLSEIVGRPLRGELGNLTNDSNRRLDRKVFLYGRPLPPYEVEVIAPEGKRSHFLVTKDPLKDSNGAITHVVTTATDITDRKRAEAHLIHIAHHDSLTNLPNRTYLSQRIDEEIASRRKNGGSFALHFLDLDRFKSINDALGHRTGDRYLEMVAERLQSCVGHKDMVARLGGDEFAIMQTDLQRPDDATALARRIVEVIEEPFYLDGQELRTSASIGITRFPQDGTSSDELLRHADMAMYQSKAEGGNVYRLFAFSMDQYARESIALETDLRQALLSDQLELYYQPQVDIGTGRIFGAEALLRWHRPGAGLVAPDAFLGIAEETGLILPIGEWVLMEACREAKRWHEAGYEDLKVAVNLSPTQFRKQVVPDMVAAALSSTRLPASALELEITEHIVMHGSEAVENDLKAIQRLGCKISIDDFGTGYSSLMYLSRFSINGLKIDRAFTRSIGTESNNTAIAKAIVGLGTSLGLGVLAEGVETEDQAHYLLSIGCAQAQGYYYGKPMPASAFLELVAGQHCQDELA